MSIITVYGKVKPYMSIITVYDRKHNYPSSVLEYTVRRYNTVFRNVNICTLNSMLSYYLSGHRTGAGRIIYNTYYLLYYV